MTTEATAPSRFDDASARRRALEAPGSVLVRAPAGSGKTELLIQRFLRLLATVDEPEAIVALTFTRKAAGEMRQRLLAALAAAAGAAPDEPHKRLTWELARAAQARNRERAWHLEVSPARLQIMTLDGLALKLASRMPWLARLGPAPRPTEDAEALYRAAAHATLALIDAEEEPAAAARALLRHLHADLDTAEAMVAGLLARRAGWLPLVLSGAGREEFEAELRRVVLATLAQVQACVHAELTEPLPLDLPQWRVLADQHLTQKGEPRKRPATYLSAAACAALHRTRSLPDPAFSAGAWTVLAALLPVLRRAAAELQLEFAARGECDFTEITLAALAALGASSAPSTSSAFSAPTALAYALDARVQHLFVDEFQDTSRVQYRLLERLTADWSAGDGRTLFLVGDPMQSIYRFRDAEVELFLEAERARRLGAVMLECVELSRNYRSGQDLVAWVERHFEPRSAGIAAGGEASVHAIASRNPRAEALRVAAIVKQELAAGTTSIGVLVHSRKHVAPIRAALRRLDIDYEGRKLLHLGSSPVVLDLLALTRALVDPGDRVAWLALLRAPWCGLTLADLHTLCADDRDTAVLTLWHARRERLTPAGAQRVAATLSVLEAATRQRGRWPARALVEWCWHALQGPTCAAAYAGDAAAFFEHLSTLGAYPDVDALQTSLAGLFAPDAHAAAGRVQIMPVHQAKGLEFDAVILPGLGRRLGAIERDPLLRWVDAGGGIWLVAPKPAAGEDPCTPYALIKSIEHEKNRAERTRQLYVAMTRPRQRLHLVAAMPIDRHGDQLKAPVATSPLARIWETLRPEFERQFQWHRSAAGLAAAEALSAQLAEGALPGPPRLRRVRTVPATVPAPEPAPALGALGALTPGNWERAAGTAVHAVLRQMAESGVLDWSPAHLDHHLRAAGVLPADLAAARARARAALRRVLADERGRWLLGAHAQARSEWTLSGVNGADLEHRAIDRSFVEEGVRWIIDYKITAPAPGVAPTTWLQAELARYQPQLENYARLITALEGTRPLRCALYFPLTGDWHAWEPAPQN